MNQIYLEWLDSVGKSHYTEAEGERPASVLLRGIAWLVEETDTDLIVAAYLGDDGGFMDMVAIPKVSIEKREAHYSSLADYSSSTGGQQTTP